ncbi:hypothetical protein BTN50_0207 [Candidatus Enterovibrio altilux]|uniref:Uncharacterized protein n=1 Tax=Candidatus Enterovibrio altilux TaxID=1927128 RepID=A0A291B6X3_9GAMM|nr:hypothetical protein BTN50_0207 [Candidatus Enterovibrio luxaltus]
MTDINTLKIIVAELSAFNAVNSEVYLTCFNKLSEESMQYQAMELTIPDNVMKPFVLNEWVHSLH